MPRHTSPQASDCADIVAPPPVILGGALVLGSLIGARRRSARAAAGTPWLPAAAAAAAGISLGIGAMVALRTAGTHLSPYRPATVLVMSGPFRRSRNPAYLGATALYVSVALALRSRPALTLLPFALGILEWGVIVPEERYLERRFGADYRRYAARVRRWF